MTDVSKLSLAAKLRLFDRPIAFQRSFVDLGAGVTGALMLSQAVYWTTRTSSEDGWFYKSMEQWQEETGLSRSEQETARKRLVRAGVLAEKKQGLPCKLFFRINVDVMLSKIIGLSVPETPDPDGGESEDERASKQGCGNPANKDAGKPRARSRKSRKPARGKPADLPAETPHAITETTAETTPEITADTLPGQGADAPEPALEGEYLGAEEDPGQQSEPKTALERYRENASGPKDEDCKTFKAWANYAIAYEKIYSVWPLWNASAAGQMSKFIDKVGAETAPKLAAHYLKLKDSTYLKSSHDVALMLRDAQAINTAYHNGRAMNGTIARQMEAQEANLSAAAQIREQQADQEVKPNAFLR